MSKSSIESGGRALSAVILTSLVCILLASVLPPLPAEAAPPIATLPPRPAPVFPPRPTKPVLPSEDNDKDDEPIGAYIELQVQGVRNGAWTMIQWQDSVGVWHDVEGWRSTLDRDNKQVWWVAGADFGKGPFRWVVYQAPEGKLLAKSKTFTLPNSAGETVIIKVSLAR